MAANLAVACNWPLSMEEQNARLASGQGIDLNNLPELPEAPVGDVYPTYGDLKR
jgi:hypothetical protein